MPPILAAVVAADLLSQQDWFAALIAIAIGAALLLIRIIWRR